MCFELKKKTALNIKNSLLRRSSNADNMLRDQRQHLKTVPPFTNVVKPSGYRQIEEY